MKSYTDDITAKFEVILPKYEAWGCIEKQFNMFKQQYYFVHYKGKAYIMFKDTRKVGRTFTLWEKDYSDFYIDSLTEKDDFYPVRDFSEFEKDNLMLLLDTIISDSLGNIIN